MNPLNLAIFCGSGTPKNEKLHHELNQFLDQLFKRNNINLVYGGASIGVMAMAANHAMKYGRHATGIMPKLLVEKEVAHKSLTTFEEAEDMHQRKARMYDLSDAFLILPGGYGTLDELFEISTWAQLGVHSKPIMVLNAGGYFDELINFIQSSVDHGFVSKQHQQLIKVISNLDDVERILTLHQ